MASQAVPAQAASTMAQPRAFLNMFKSVASKVVSGGARLGKNPKKEASHEAAAHLKERITRFSFIKALFPCFGSGVDVDPVALSESPLSHQVANTSGCACDAPPDDNPTSQAASRIASFGSSTQPSGGGCAPCADKPCLSQQGVRSITLLWEEEPVTFLVDAHTSKEDQEHKVDQQLAAHKRNAYLQRLKMRVAGFEQRKQQQMEAQQQAIAADTQAQVEVVKEQYLRLINMLGQQMEGGKAELQAAMAQLAVVS